MPIPSKNLPCLSTQKRFVIQVKNARVIEIEYPCIFSYHEWLTDKRKHCAQAEDFFCRERSLASWLLPISPLLCPISVVFVPPEKKVIWPTFGRSIFLGSPSPQSQRSQPNSLSLSRPLGSRGRTNDHIPPMPILPSFPLSSVPFALYV